MLPLIFFPPLGGVHTLRKFSSVVVHKCVLYALNKPHILQPNLAKLIFLEII